MFSAKVSANQGA